MDLVFVQEEYWPMLKTTVGCSEQLAKAPCAMRAATMAIMPEIVFPSLPSLGTGKSKGKGKAKGDGKGGSTSFDAHS